MASFVENVNKLSLNLDTIVKASSMFDDSVLPVLEEVAALDLQEVTEDFKKGNYLGNRKIDIDLSLNKLTSASIVSYSRADITLVGGSIISIPFLSGASVLELTSHNDIRNYIVNDALWAGIQYTECTIEESTATTPTLIRFRDSDGHSSNIERVELTVYSGTAKDIKPVYFWAQTTSALQTIANRVGDIIALGNNMGNVIELSQRIDELNELQAELTSLLEIHANLAEILQADTNAGIATTKAAEALASKTAALQALSDATTQATIATNQAIIATNKSNEIKAITTQTATGAAGSLAQVSYNSTDGKLSFVVPQGLKGDRGEAFSVSAMGTFAQRTGYDAQPINFSYFATDMSLIYFKQSATSGDWSVGIPFGKGDKGDTGLTGNGISTITKISGTGAAGSADTYRITYTSGGTFDFTVWNGTESVISVAGKSGTVTLAKADVGLGNVDNTTDLLKPLSTATTNALALKANDSTVVHKTGDTMTGDLNFGGTGLRITGDFSNTTLANRLSFQTNVSNGNTTIPFIPNGTGTITILQCLTSPTENYSSLELRADSGIDARIRADKKGTGIYLPMTFYTGGAERLRIDTSGNVLATGSGGLGYGTGSGGTVTQLTSKSTAVTLNKPCGHIIMNNSALAAGGIVHFLLNNSLISLNDTVVATFKDASADDIRLYRVEAISQGTGYSWIKITNTHSLALAESPVITFAILKGATA